MAQQSNSWARPVMLSTTASDRWRAIPAVINVPKDWDDLTPEWCLVAIGLGRCEEGPPVCRGKVWPHRASFNVGHRGSLAAGQRRELYRLLGN